MLLMWRGWFCVGGCLAKHRSLLHHALATGILPGYDFRNCTEAHRVYWWVGHLFFTASWMQYFSLVCICLPWDSCLWYGQYVHLYFWLVSWPVCFFSFIFEFGICHLVPSSTLSSSSLSSFSFFFFIAFLLKLFVVECNISYLNLLLWIVFWIIVSYFLLFWYLG
jgi:hypothetical protein